MAKVNGAPRSRRTQAQLDELARKFESEYGPADFKPRRGGRPALGGTYVTRSRSKVPVPYCGRPLGR
jgi:hypothetical protein